MYEKHFGLINNGIFVEIGAYDGEYVSNTSFLVDLGWYGHYIEPVPEYFDKCKMRYANNLNTQIYNMAIGDSSEPVSINVSGVLSSIDKGSIAKFKQLNWEKSLVTDRQIEIQ